MVYFSNPMDLPTMSKYVSSRQGLSVSTAQPCYKPRTSHKQPLPLSEVFLSYYLLNMLSYIPQLTRRNYPYIRSRFHASYGYRHVHQGRDLSSHHQTDLISRMLPLTDPIRYAHVSDKGARCHPCIHSISVHEVSCNFLLSLCQASVGVSLYQTGSHN